MLSAVPPTSVCVDMNKKQLSMTIPVSTPPHIVPAVRISPNCPLLTLNRLKKNIPRNGLVQHTPPPNMVCPANTAIQSLPTHMPLKDPYFEASTHQRINARTEIHHPATDILAAKTPTATLAKKNNPNTVRFSVHNATSSAKAVSKCSATGKNQPFIENTSPLQMGHSPLFPESHSRMQCVWNECRQGKPVNTSPSSYMSRHIAHMSSSARMPLLSKLDEEGAAALMTEETDAGILLAVPLSAPWPPCVGGGLFRQSVNDLSFRIALVRQPRWYLRNFTGQGGVGQESKVKYWGRHSIHSNQHPLEHSHRWLGYAKVRRHLHTMSAQMRVNSEWSM